MRIGDVWIVSGMVLTVAAADYAGGVLPVRLFVEYVVGTCTEWDVDWVIVEGREKVPGGPWRHRRIQVQVSALRRCLA